MDKEWRGPGRIIALDNKIVFIKYGRAIIHTSEPRVTRAPDQSVTPDVTPDTVQGQGYQVTQQSQVTPVAPVVTPVTTPQRMTRAATRARLRAQAIKAAGGDNPKDEDSSDSDDDPDPVSQEMVMVTSHTNLVIIQVMKVL